MSTSSATRRTLLWIGLPGLIALGAVIWFMSRPVSQAQIAPDSDAPVQATTTTVQQQNVPIYFNGVGTVNPWASVTVRARIDGRLDSVGFEEGGDVSEGQLIAQLDSRTQEAQLDQALAQKAKDQALLTNARRDQERYAGLAKLDAVARQTLDAQRAKVAELEASLKFDDAQISYARTQLSYTQITAPIAGRVGARLVDPGNIVRATDPDGLVVINQIDPIAVVFTLPEDTLGQINRAMLDRADPLEVIAYSRDETRILATGELVLLDNQINARTGTIQVKGRFANSEHVLWPGQYVNARLVLGEREQVLTIPAESVLRGAQGTYTYVVDDKDVVHVQPIHAVVIQDGIAVIDQGLSAGQRIVIDGQYKLRPGLRITEAASVQGQSN